MEARKQRFRDKSPELKRRFIDDDNFELSNESINKLRQFRQDKKDISKLKKDISNTVDPRNNVNAPLIVQMYVARENVRGNTDYLNL